MAGAGALAWYRLSTTVRHVTVTSASRRAADGSPNLVGGTTVVVAVRLPGGASHVLVLHDQAGRADVLSLPGRLMSRPGHQAARAIDHVAPEAARRLVATVESLGLPVAHYVGLDLAHVAPTSALGQLVADRRSASGIIRDPLAAGAVLSGLVHHLVLDRRTSLQRALDLLSLRSCRSQHLPVSPDGRLAVPTAAARGVVSRFLRTAPTSLCRAPVGALLAK